jgi:hypothetical protein
MKNLITKIIPYLEAIPAVSTIISGVYFAIKAQSGTLSTDQILGGILVVVTLMATSLFIDRLTKLNRIEKEVMDASILLKSREEKPSLQNTLSTRKQLGPLETRLENATEIFITGASLFRLSSEYLGLFDKLLDNNCKIKLLLLDPESYSARIVAKNIVYEINDFEVYKSYIISSLNSFSKLKDKYGDRIQIRISEYLPSYSLLGTNCSLPSGKVMVEFYVHKVPTRERPHIEVFRNLDSNWFDFYCGQFSSLWNDSKDYNKSIENLDLFNSNN